MTAMTEALKLTPSPSSLTREDFVAQFGDIFEHSPWIAAEAWDSGLTSTHDDPLVLAESMAEILRSAASERQMQVICAHPDLAGKAALAGELTDDSTREQAGVGLDQCTPEELARFETLNNAYKERFGFPFIMAVKGSNRFLILDAFEVRLKNSIEEEQKTAVEQINKIARLRLVDRAE
ncbi:2-oxo-4-hydroxy-4-carboxy-5-ureidoimidazoline decarboxylase [Microbulbifer celer]|uniref:2-oxo-4-hydroxy-4-carboxy-5-ureidoimidazoline decarboxylase n=1 Tax=Microbulbifer celer TaxID=435905 RepID=A0ABW3U7Z6_9GAMM|nr:2-oxo-4-hydroxy-4-carboxy-5-ureidoimidazoline decarboxylase [Microbulbifer celer]UFN57734.1 2-oxo-4-hydroxy-4-carboxy-5-ureidoimidazoline decarboxylase [Microbulbifer celer]